MLRNHRLARCAFATLALLAAYSATAQQADATKTGAPQLEAKPAPVTAQPLVPVSAEGQSAADGQPAAGGEAQPQPTGPQPKLVMPETSFDAGDISKGQVIEHDFIVRNEGQAELTILNVKPSCGCTTPGFDKIIPVGGQGKITLKVDTSKFKGPISKSASVTSNDPAQPTLRLVVAAKVNTFIDLTPRDIITFRQYRGEVKKEEVTVHSNEPGEFKIKDVQVTGDGIKHELKPAGDGTTDYKLAVWLDEKAPVGQVNGSLQLLTNSTKEPQVTVTVRGNVLGQISLNPSTLYFRVDGAKQELQVAASTLNIRERGELGAPIVAELKKGDPLTRMEEAGEWDKVQTREGKEGWVYKKLVEPLAGQDTAQSKVLNVTHRQAQEFKLLGAEVIGDNIDAKSLKVETEAVKEGSTYRVKVTYEGGLDKGNYTGKVILKTSDTDEPTIEVPLYIVVT